VAAGVRSRSPWPSIDASTDCWAAWRGAIHVKLVVPNEAIFLIRDYKKTIVKSVNTGIPVSPQLRCAVSLARSRGGAQGAEPVLDLDQSVSRGSRHPDGFIPERWARSSRNGGRQSFRNNDDMARNRRSAPAICLEWLSSWAKIARAITPASPHLGGAE